MKQEVISNLPGDYPWAQLVQYRPVTGSTNDDLKQLARQGAPQGTAIVAGSQTGGHGRLGRSFHSPEGMGVYLSLLLRPACSPLELMHLTCATAVAACHGVEDGAGVRPSIKWTNDLVYGQRKLGGILTELGLSPHGNVDWAIIGIGINCRQKAEDFPREIADMAGSLSMVTGRPADPAVVAAALLTRFYQMHLGLMEQKEAVLEEYRKNCVTLGREVCAVRGDCIRHGRALDVDDQGALLVRYEDGTLERVNSGEVSIRGMYGYL